MNTNDPNDQPSDEPAKPQEILGKLAGLPIYTWNYRHGPSGERHVGLSPAEFRTVFGVGGSDDEIELTDAVGVLMAALHALFYASDCYVTSEFQKRDAYIGQLEGRIRALEDGLRAVVN